ncbi:FAD binding domain protein [Tricladium varicosporioides]|nr:FAD binding domain protein [Hymenoscyphus varicosporioides]
MKSSWVLAAVISAIAPVFGQDAVTSSLIAAATTVAISDTSALLFSSESVQLTDEVLVEVAKTLQNDTLAELFGFSTVNSTLAAISKRWEGRICKLLPGDWAWPADFVWDILNILLGDSLIKTVPSAAPCYKDWPEYDPVKCAAIEASWRSSNLHMNDPTSVMLPLYEGRTCMPPSVADKSTCTVGGYPSYAVNVSNVAQIQLAVNFARNANLRLVVKNTGHDFAGKASGAGALSVWTHWLKDKSYFANFKADNGYVGPAIKVGAGVQVWEVYEYANSLGVTALGGEAVTVGMAGGWTAGGGHSPLSSLYGLGADQVLSMEVVLADGRFITATSKKNPDVFWMMRGGGGSTIGVVTSLTVKVYPKLIATTVLFNWTLSGNVTNTTFWQGISAYFDNIEKFVDVGTYGYHHISAASFTMAPFFAPNMTIEQTKALLKPLFDKLAAIGLPVNPYYNFADNYHDAWKPAFPQERVGGATVKTASRLMPRYAIHDPILRERTFGAYKAATERGYFVTGFHISGKGIAVTPPTDAAVLPAWRTALTHTIVGAGWAVNATIAEIKEKTLAVTSFMDVFRAIAPDSGAYMSEADLIEPNLQQEFYGSNYPRLHMLKEKYDPSGVFFALTAVGSEDWEVLSEDGLWNNNGRLCRVQG